jgi:ubiquinone/menaquinone biosynthesis C-methylase UbiE
MAQGRFDRDSEALRRRLLAHERYGARDLNEWIFGHLRPRRGNAVLDLGCGTGKQSLPLAKAVGSAGCVVSIDISQDALDSLVAEARAAAVAEWIKVYCRELDGFGEDLAEARFDLVLASFSLYYARDRRRVLEEVHRVLKVGGVVFFCGPSSRNNLELKSLIASLRGKISYDTAAVPNFMEVEGPRLAREVFAQTEVFAFENPLRFDSVGALVDYWSAHNLYEEALAPQFKEEAAAHFRTRGEFVNVKRVIGVRAVK